MKKYIFVFIQVILISCSIAPLDKANKLVEDSKEFMFFGNVERIDSIYGYEQPYNSLCAASMMEWNSYNKLSNNSSLMSDKLKEELSSNGNTIYSLRIDAANEELKLALSDEKKSFVGFYTTKETKQGIVTLYFDKTLKRIIGIEKGERKIYKGRN